MEKKWFIFYAYRPAGEHYIRLYKATGESFMWDDGYNTELDAEEALLKLPDTHGAEELYTVLPIWVTDPEKSK